MGESADGLGWIGSHKMDPWTTLTYGKLSTRGTAYAAYRFNCYIETARLVSSKSKTIFSRPKREGIHQTAEREREFNLSDKGR